MQLLHGWVMKSQEGVVSCVGPKRLIIHNHWRTVLEEVSILNQVCRRQVGEDQSKPARYCLAINSCPQVSASQEGGSCEVRVTDGSRESRQSRDARREERGKN